MVTFPPVKPPPFTTIGGVPSCFAEKQSTPNSCSESRRGPIGRVLRLLSPVNMLYPESISEQTEVAILIVVPEFPASMTVSGVFKAVPIIRNEDLSEMISDPMALHAFIEERVSLEIKGLCILDSPSERAARNMDLCV